MNLLSSISSGKKKVTEIVHFVDGSKKTFEGILPETVKQGQFTQFVLTDGRKIYINDKNVNFFEVISDSHP